MVSGGSADGAASGRARGESADLPAADGNPFDSLPEVARWLAQTLDAIAAIVLLGDGVMDAAAVWPPGDPLANALSDLVGLPLDERLTIWVAARQKRIVTGCAAVRLVMPDPAVTEGRAWVVAPLIARDVALGAVLVARTQPGPLGLPLTAITQVVARHVAQAVSSRREGARAARAGGSGFANGARAAQGGGSGLANAALERLAAVASVLDTLAELPPVAAPGDRDREYREIARKAAALRASIDRFVTGPREVER
jgi:hypothetical protein